MSDNLFCGYVCMCMYMCMSNMNERYRDVVTEKKIILITKTSCGTLLILLKSVFENKF